VRSKIIFFELRYRNILESRLRYIYCSSFGISFDLRDYTTVRLWIWPNDLYILPQWESVT